MKQRVTAIFFHPHHSLGLVRSTSGNSVRCRRDIREMDAEEELWFNSDDCDEVRQATSHTDDCDEVRQPTSHSDDCDEMRQSTSHTLRTFGTVGVRQTIKKISIFTNSPVVHSSVSCILVK